MVEDGEFDDVRDGMNSKYIHSMSLGSSYENNRGSPLYGSHWDSQPLVYATFQFWLVFDNKKILIRSDGTSPSSSMGSLGPPSPTSRPRASTAETPGYYVTMSTLNNRKVSVSV